MTPDERKQQGAAINGVKDRVTASLTARKDALKVAALDQRRTPKPWTLRCRCANRPPRPVGSIHYLGLRQADRDLRRHGICDRRRPLIETDDYNFTKLNFPEGVACDMHHTFYFNPKPGRFAAAPRTQHPAGGIRTMWGNKL